MDDEWGGGRWYNLNSQLQWLWGEECSKDLKRFLFMGLLKVGFLAHINIYGKGVVVAQDSTSVTTISFLFHCATLGPFPY